MIYIYTGFTLHVYIYWHVNNIGPYVDIVKKEGIN
jgi:hypothetical protein